MQQRCTDKVAGEILAGWRYDISGIAPEMREDYEQHFAECEHCRGKQRLHRTIDFGLLFIASGSALVFVLAFFAIRHFNPSRAILMELGALGGFMFSALVWVIVAISTPVPVVVAGVARSQARKLHQKLPEEIKTRIPEKIVERIQT
jgi:hypothetical protein